MSKHKKTAHKIFFLLPVAVILIALAALLFLHFRITDVQREDYRRISSESYDSVFLSMFPSNAYEAEDFATYRGMTLLKTSYEIPDAATLEKYLSRIARSGNTINTVYLGIRPQNLTSTDLLPLLQRYPNVIFEVIPAYPSLEYLSHLSEEEFSRLLISYQDLLTPLLDLEHVHVFSFFAQEWFISNPANYLSDFEATGDISRLVMLNADKDHPFLLTGQNLSRSLDRLSNLTADRRLTASPDADLSQWSVVFFGDSVIANYTDSTSVPGVVNGISAAQTYNYAVGGSSAAWEDEEDQCFPKVVERFLQKTPPEIENSSRLCFVVNFGLNDYFNGFPIDDPADAYNDRTYTGALRAGIRLLKEAFPSSDIIIMAPNFASYFTNGTEINSSVGGILTDYVAAAQIAAEDMDVLFMNNYTGLGINFQNRADYLVDGCHLNETGRFLLGTHIVRTIAGLQK